MSTRQLVIGLSVFFALIVLLASVFTVHQTDRAVLLRFREVVQADISPGIHFKFPLIDEVVRFDGRVQTLTSPSSTFFTLEKKPLMVDSFAKWRIRDVKTYYTSTGGDEPRATRLIQERVNTGLRNQISRRDMHEVISGEREQLMGDLTRDLNLVAQREFGIEVLDVRVKKIELPEKVSESVYERMSSEREIEAKQHRASGLERNVGIKADADRRRVVIAAEAYKQAEQIRGEGDAKAAATYAAAFSRDPEFYGFYRSMTAYKKTFNSKNDLMLLDPESSFFKYLKAPGGQ